MKKILLIPTTLVAAITPIIATTSCNESKNPEVTKYAFEFTGVHCKINGHDKLNVEIEENTKVEYTILPDDGFILSATQNLPQGVTLIGNLLTIEKMDKAYTVTISAEPEVSKYHFSFTGHNCKINGHDSINTDIEKDTKVEFTVLADDGYTLSETQNLPEGVTLVGNLLTIDKMDKAYAVTINAALTTYWLDIVGIKDGYEGTLGESGYTNQITVNLKGNGKITDVTKYVTFDIEGPLTWDVANKRFSWSNDIEINEYECWITAKLFDIAVSTVYSTYIDIGVRDPFITFDGLTPGQEIQVTSGEPGSVGPITFWFHSESSLDPINITNVIQMDEVTFNFVKWNGSTGKFYWDDIGYDVYHVEATMEYDDFWCDVNFILDAS